MNIPYATSTAFRRALTDRLRDVAYPYGLWSLPALQRQFAYDRLLARLYLTADEWVVKGAAALLARRVAVRHTVGLDLYRPTSRDRAERDLREAAGLDIGDWFRFEVGRGRAVTDTGMGVRAPVIARVGAVEWARFHVNVVTENIRMTGVPDDVPPLTSAVIPGLDRPGYLAYPLVDHIADKTCAIVERHGDAGRPSTRFKDLVDLVAMATTVQLAADAQRRALMSEVARRDLSLPTRFDVPDRALWKAGYAAEARRAVGLPARALDEALAVVRPLLDPVLDGTAVGVWDPKRGVWEPQELSRTLETYGRRPRELRSR